MSAAVATASSTVNPIGVRRRKRGDGRTALFFLLPNGIGFLVFTITPLLASLVLSFFAWPLIGRTSFIGVQNYVNLFTKDTTFRSAILNTLYFVAAYVPLNIVVAMTVAVWLQGYRRTRRILRVVFFVPVLTPLVADAVVWSLLFTNRNGLIDSVIHAVFHVQGPEWLSAPQWAMPSIIIVAVWQGFGYNMLLFTAGLHAIPETFYDASKIDGASRWRTFWSITVPLVSPSLFFGVLLTVITSFQVFDLAYILTDGGPGTSSTTIVYWLFEKGFNDYAMGYASAIAWVLFIIVIAITALQMRLQRHWVFYES